MVQLPNNTHDDVLLDVGDLRGLADAEAVIRLFAHLRYATNDATTVPHGVLNLDSDDLRQHIQRITYIGAESDDKEIRVYLLEVRSLTAKLRGEVARHVRNLPNNFILLMTKDFEQIDLVLMVRELVPAKTLGATIGQIMRPIPLSINRQQPTRLAIRVMQRLSVTEDDPDYQWDKIRSAFSLVEWSEEYFNNRALFSDYYLNHRVTDGKLTPEWNEDVAQVGRNVFSIIGRARNAFSGKPFATMQTSVYQPLLKLLGFEWKQAPASADYHYDLYDSAHATTPIARMFAYVWNRTLDGPDEVRDHDTPMIIPGSLVVTELQRNEVPWVIVTNGKIWRLYSSTASNKATNYYEVDLDEALHAKDQLAALKYWWLMFRKQAFMGFLDRVRQQSQEYAKELGERLKDRVFVSIFPEFAQGFIADMRAKGITTFTPEQLNTVFTGTLTFLYRLMFVLYAESLELVPINDERGYGMISVKRLKHEIAKVGGIVQDEAPAKLHAHYSPKRTDLYQQLTDVFTVIDRGDPTVNMPTYNGGLFNPASASGQFLAMYAIPDRYLARGLDRLARDVDSRTQALVMIDFKSLGVRQLGSIYEGLLEFKLNIASEKLAVTKEKGKEVYQPFANVAKPLSVIEQGAAYLTNDKKERKATGSYYTPDYIVKYIVEHTVGAVLDQKFAMLREQLHHAQRDYRNYKKLVEARAKTGGRSESAETFWNEQAMRQLVDACLNIRVLDPAMGSGHFLVEVVDYISNRLLDFLNAWSENPVWAFLQQTRDDIMDEMERQGVTIDPDRLTRVALLKRAVLKRCIYGVDLNAMAVELAKVSLWLDAFTLGAPLSFLDHHLKHGNSLIGARIDEVQAYLNVGGAQMHMLAGGEFAGLALATDLMRQVSYLSDNTVDQAQQSATAFHSADVQLAPFKRMLDVYTSRWFGNQQSKKSKTDEVNIFLRAPSSKAWFNDPSTPLDDSLIHASTIAANAQAAAAAKHFFHWELEFPEIFFAPSQANGQDVQLNPNGGFDAVVGNPPYERTKELEEDKLFYSIDFLSSSGAYDIYVIFIELSKRMIVNNSFIGLIVSNKFLVADYGEKIRKIIYSELFIERIIDLTECPSVFEEVLVSPVILMLKKTRNRNDKSLVAYFKKDVPQKIFNIERKYGDFEENDIVSGLRYQELLFDELNGHINIYIIGEIKDTLDKIYNCSNTLNEIAFVRTGIMGFNYWSLEPLTSDNVDDKDSIPLLTPGLIERYESRWDVNEVSLFKKVYKSPVIYNDSSTIDKNTWNLFISKKIVVSGVSRKLTALYDDQGLGLLVAVHAVVVTNSLSYGYVLAVINSALCNWIHVIKYYSARIPQGSLRYPISFIEKLPIRKIEFTTPPQERATVADMIVSEVQAGNYDQALRRVEQVLAKGITDIVHDVLAQLAQRMIDLNQDKQRKTKQFLSQLEATLKIMPKNGEGGINSLKGKTFLTGYLGDYQKGERETAWKDFYFRLHENRTRFNVALSTVEASIKQRYEQSLAELLPIKHDLARTDALIDKIVYRLYGLTDAEIELIERPHYEQALIEAKADVLKNKELDDEEKLEKIADAILPAAERFFERVEPLSVEQHLDADLPTWRSLPPQIPTFLRTGDYNLRNLDDSMDFSTSVIPYTKSVETYVIKRIFEPFRDESGYSATHCVNKFLQEFMAGTRHLTLGNFGIILKSSKESALRSFISSRFANAASVIFGTNGMAEALGDEAMRTIRNKAAHDEVISRDEASAIRAWVMGILQV